MDEIKVKLGKDNRIVIPRPIVEMKGWKQGDVLYIQIVKTERDDSK